MILGPEESALEKNLASVASDMLSESGEILRALRRATLDTKLVEVEFSNRSRIFFTNLMEGPHPDEEAALVEKEKERKSLSFFDTLQNQGCTAQESIPPLRLNYDYLEHKKHLYLAPLTPLVGNSMLPTSQIMLLRFFHGVKALEVPTVYLGSLDLGGEHLVKVAFPMRIYIIAKRRHFRAIVAPLLQMLVEVVPEDKKIPPFTTKLMNLSAGGLAFCNPLGLGVPALEQRLTLNLIPEDQEEIKITAMVRNHSPITQKEGCGKHQSRCGVQFEITSQDQAMHIEALVAWVQRQVIAMVAEVQKPAPLPKAEVSRRRKEPSALDRLFEVKKRKSGTLK